MEKINNRDYSRDERFISFCERAKVTPTKRQASKFRMKKGKAYKFGAGKILKVGK